MHSSNSSFSAVVVLLGSPCSDVDLLVGLLDLSRGFWRRRFVGLAGTLDGREAVWWVIHSSLIGRWVVWKGLVGVGRLGSDCDLLRAALVLSLKSFGLLKFRGGTRLRFLALVLGPGW